MPPNTFTPFIVVLGVNVFCKKSHYTMKKSLLLAGLLFLAMGLNTAAIKGGEMLPLGAVAPLQDYPMQGIDGRSHHLASLAGERGLLLIFSCNTCPFVLAWEDQYPKLATMARKANLGMALVNSNEAKRSGDDSAEAMRKHAEEAGYDVPYLIDKDHKLADAFGAKTTPHVYLFDSDMKLVYRGSINDKFENKSKQAKKFYLKEAIEALVKGQKIEPADTREIGCSIKRV